MSERKRVVRRPADKKKRGGSSNFMTWIVVGIGAVIILVVIGIFVFGKSGGSAATTDPMDKSQGPANAKVVITEYGDFQCPGCKLFALTIEPKLKADFVDTNKARMEFRQMSFIGDESLAAAEATECANEQGRFWEAYTKVYTEQNGENVGTFSNDNLARFAKDLGLDMTKYNQCMSSHKYRAKVQNETAAGQTKGVYSTPTVMIDGVIANWNGDYATLKGMVQAAIDKAN